MLNEEKIKNFLLKKYYKELRATRQLRTATVEILNACNFKCVHCYNQNLKTCIMPKELFFNIVDQLTDLGCKNITITGGEPTLHPDFKQIYKYCFDKGLKITLYTNGYYLNKFFDFLKTNTPETIDISIYGTTNKTYKNVCQIDDAFDTVDKNIKSLQKLKIKTTLKSVIMKQNHKEFDDMLNYCINLNLDFRFDLNLLNSKDDSNDQSDNILNDDQYNHIMEEVSLLKTGNWISFLTRENMQSNSDRLYSCGAGYTSLFINCFGGVRLCNFAGFSEENIKEKSLNEIWKNFEKYLKLEKDKSSRCYNCIYKKFCAICPVITYTKHKTDGTVILPVMQNCREAKFIFDKVKNAKEK